jgi:hypothetical protein
VDMGHCIEREFDSARWLPAVLFSNRLEVGGPPGVLEGGELPGFDGWRDVPKALSGVGQLVILVRQLTHRIDGAIKITERQADAETSYIAANRVRRSSSQAFTSRSSSSEPTSWSKAPTRSSVSIGSNSTSSSPTSAAMPSRSPRKYAWMIAKALPVRQCTWKPR